MVVWVYRYREMGPSSCHHMGVVLAWSTQAHDIIWPQCVSNNSPGVMSYSIGGEKLNTPVWSTDNPEPGMTEY